MPIPNENETRKQFMDRCIPILINEGKDKTQAIVICSNLWENNLKRDTDLWWYRGNY